MIASFVSVGGNLGPVSKTIRQAFALIAEHSGVCVEQLSGLYRTAAVGGAEGETFLNAAARIDTDLPPLELLQLLHTVESQFGRIRHHRWEPRMLDLDLILYGDQIIDLPELCIPHPCCWYRRFVLEPMAEIAPNAVHPEKRQSIQCLCDRLRSDPFRFAVSGANDHLRNELIGQLADEYSCVKFINWDSMEVNCNGGFQQRTTGNSVKLSHGKPLERFQESLEPTILAWLGPLTDEADRRSGSATALPFQVESPPVERSHAHEQHSCNKVANSDDALNASWLDASRVDTTEIGQFLREVLQSALGLVEKTSAEA